MAQRILSARNERDGLLSVLWFNFAHYALRSWPWILAALGRRGALSEPGAAGVRLRAAGRRPLAARGARFAGSGISGGVHVHDCHAPELGQLVSCFGFLPPLRAAQRNGKTLRARFAMDHAICWWCWARGFPGNW